VVAVTQELGVVVLSLAQAHRVKVRMVERITLRPQHMGLAAAAVLALKDASVLQHLVVMVELD
jgi:hypothetical protein